MGKRFGLMCVVAVAMVGGSVSKADAQIVLITGVNYKAAAGGNPPSANPQGTMNLPAQGSYRVFIDYGILNNGGFAGKPLVSLGGPGTEVNNAGGNHNWTSNAVHTLTNPPAGLHARARIQQKVAGVWADVPGAVTYAPCP